MGKALILSGANPYQIEIIPDTSWAEAREEFLTEQLSELETELAKLQSKYDEEKQLLKLAVLFQSDAIEALIQALKNDDEQALQAARATLKEKTKYVVVQQLKTQPLAQQISLIKAQKIAAEVEIEHLINASGYVDAEAWCVDDSENLSGEVGTIDLPDGTTLIRPGHDDNAAHQQVRDGILQPVYSSHAANFALHYIFHDAWLIHMPRYRAGTVVGVMPGQCEIELDEYETPEQYRQLLAPINYMGDCEPFEPDDRVIVAFLGDWDNAEVVGFETNPRPCQNFTLIISLKNPDELHRQHSSHLLGGVITTVHQLEGKGLSYPSLFEDDSGIRRHTYIYEQIFEFVPDIQFFDFHSDFAVHTFQNIAYKNLPWFYFALEAYGYINSKRSAYYIYLEIKPDFGFLEWESLSDEITLPTQPRNLPDFTNSKKLIVVDLGTDYIYTGPSGLDVLGDEMYQEYKDFAATKPDLTIYMPVLDRRVGTAPADMDNDWIPKNRHLGYVDYAPLVVCSDDVNFPNHFPDHVVEFPAEKLRDLRDLVLDIFSGVMVQGSNSLTLLCWGAVKIPVALNSRLFATAIKPQTAAIAVNADAVTADTEQALQLEFITDFAPEITAIDNGGSLPAFQIISNVLVTEKEDQTIDTLAIKAFAVTETQSLFLMAQGWSRNPFIIETVIVFFFNVAHSQSLASNVHLYGVIADGVFGLDNLQIDVCTQPPACTLANGNPSKLVPKFLIQNLKVDAIEIGLNDGDSD